MNGSLNILITARRNAHSIIVSLLLLSAITIPGIISYFESDSGLGHSEKRQLASLPHWPTSFNEYKEFPSKMSLYYKDHFGLRHYLQNIYFKFKVLGLGVSSTRKVLIGKDNWFFYTGQNVIEQTRNLLPYKTEELAALSKTLQWRKDWLSKQNIDYIWMVAPNKHTIYSENLPDYVSKVGAVSRLDQWMTYFSENTSVPIVDFRNVLLENKKYLPVYDRADSHWNSFGAYIAYEHFIEFLKRTFPDVDPVNINKSDFNVVVASTQDLAMLMGINYALKMSTVKPKSHFPQFAKKYKIWNEAVWETFGNHEPFYYSCKNKKKTALIFHDSFFEALFPYFGDTFSKTVFVRARPNFLMMKWFVDIYKPDLVIEEIGERGNPFRADDIDVVDEVSNTVRLVSSHSIQKAIFKPQKESLPFCAVDRLNYLPVSFDKTEATMTNTVPLRVSGWVVDHLNKNTPATALIGLVPVDQSAYFETSININTERHDVADYFGNNNFNKSGFTADLEISSVPAGRYMLRILVPHNNSFIVCNLNKEIIVVNNNMQQTSEFVTDKYRSQYFDKLYRRADAINCSIDAINNLTPQRMTQLHVDHDRMLRISGWAIDYKWYLKPSNNVILKMTNIKNKNILLYKTDIRIERPDVTNKYKTPDHLASGFLFNIDSKTIPAGNYNLEIVLPRSATKSICATSYNINVVN